MRTVVSGMYCCLQVVHADIGGILVHLRQYADPDPDPVGSRLFGSPRSGSGSLVPKNTNIVILIVFFNMYYIVKNAVSDKLLFDL